MEMMVKELERGLQAAYQLHIELTQRLIEKQQQQHNNEELMASMDHHIAVILQSFQNCIARLRNPNIQDPSIPNTIPADDAECFDIARLRQSEPVVITTDLKEDGFKWRKYGKKPILSSKYPREYYKCRYTENGCRAFKYVQMICDAPTKYRVVYSGSHTCKHLLGDSPQMLNFCGSSKSSNLEPEQGHVSSECSILVPGGQDDSEKAAAYRTL
ncbi:hypothetical protein Cgig2_008797 [Carnegiea gigantea]|uniref:WRKY domain-containing protein n=1 Tax=Carnegiea gigantea TaxID=171969 RepID=A0A9Q1JQV6_9CARY|nr:hypothetical protein Cgig2_008797 [Carnegiea gigantea]